MESIDCKTWMSSKHQIVRGKPCTIMYSCIVGMRECWHMSSPVIFLGCCDSWIIFNSVMLNLSTMPFPIGWKGVVLVFLIQAISQSFQNVHPCHYDFLRKAIWDQKKSKRAIAVVFTDWFFAGIALAYLAKWSAKNFLMSLFGWFKWQVIYTTNPIDADNVVLTSSILFTVAVFFLMQRPQVYKNFQVLERWFFFSS